MAHCLTAVGKAVVDALSHDLKEVVPHRMRDIFAQDISTERQRQSGFAFPPFAKIDNLGKTGARVSELPFMNDETGPRLVVSDSIEDLVKRDNDVLEIAEIKLQGEIGAGHSARHRNY